MGRATTQPKEGNPASTNLHHWWDEGTGQWSQQGITSSVNIAGNVVTAQVSHLSLFAVLGETRRVFLPVVLGSR